MILDDQCNPYCAWKNILRATTAATPIATTTIIGQRRKAAATVIAAAMVSAAPVASTVGAMTAINTYLAFKDLSDSFRAEGYHIKGDIY